MQNVLLLILLATLTACSPKQANICSLELVRKYPNSAFFVASGVPEVMHEPELKSSKSYTVGKEKTVYVNKALLTVSNEKEQMISLPYVRPNKNIKLGYEIPKNLREREKGVKTNKVKFLEMDKSLVYPLQYLKNLPNEYYLPQEELVTDKEVIVSETKSISTKMNNALLSPDYYVLVGDVFVGLYDDMSLAHVFYLRHNLEYIPIHMNDSELELTFIRLTKSKKTALSANNYSVIFLGKKGNTLRFRKVYNNSDKASEYSEVKMSSPQVEVFGHNILVQTATRETLHCIIQK